MYCCSKKSKLIKYVGNVRTTKSNNQLVAIIITAGVDLQRRSCTDIGNDC